MRNLTVLITGAGAPGAPGIIKSLKNISERNIKIIGVDINPRAAGFSMVDKSYIVPNAEDDNFINSIENICLKEEVHVILPLVTKELFKFSDAKDRFKSNHICIAVSDSESLYTANDKGKLIKFLQERGVDIPKYKIAKDYNSFAEAARYLNYPNNPICFKPTVANGSRGFRIINPFVNKGDLIFNYKPESTYIAYEEIFEVLKSMEKMPELIVMEYLPGEEYSIDMLVNNGKALYTIPRKREKMIGGISVVSTTIKDDQIIDYCNSIVTELGITGNVGIQVKRDLNGIPKILEINPRVQGSIVLCTASGVNMPYYGIKLAIGEAIPQVNINWGTQMVRYWEELYYDSYGHAFTL